MNTNPAGTQSRVTLDDIVYGSVPVLTGRNHRLTVVQDRLESTVALDQLRGVAEKRGKRFFVLWIAMLFGSDIPTARIESLHDELLSGSFEHPPIRLVVASCDSLPLGAYDSARSVIEVDRALALDAANGDMSAAWTVLAILVEEFGHHIDNVLRCGNGDSIRDEGARFGYSLLNLGWNSHSQFEFGRYYHAHRGRWSTLTVDWSEHRTNIERLLGEQHQADDDQEGRLEHFGAGRLAHERNAHSWGHRSLEEALLPRASSPEDQKRISEIYFGNWLRDYSQFLTPQTEMLADVWPEVANCLAHAEFGQHRSYDVNSAILGRYEYREHVDHPHGIAGADTDLFEIHPDTWLPRYVGVQSPQSRTTQHEGTSAAYIHQELTGALESGDTAAGRRRLGGALHVIEDYFAHSNFSELILIELGHRDVPPMTSQRIGGVPPVVTGTFGGADTTVSILLGLAEHLSAVRACECYESQPSWEVRAAFAIVGRLLRGVDGLGHDRDALDGLWNRYADDALVVVHHMNEQGWLRDDPVRHVVMRNVQRLAEYLYCASTRPIAAIGSMIIAGLADVIAQRMLEHSVAFDGSAGSLLHDAGTEITHGQTVVAGVGEVPTHSQLSKDHDDHPLHDLAARCAVVAVRAVYEAVRDQWSTSSRDVADVYQVARAFLVHPRKIPPSSPAMELYRLADDWSRANGAAIRRLGAMTEGDWIERHRCEWREASSAARRIAVRAVGEQRADRCLEEVRRYVRSALSDGAH